MPPRTKKKQRSSTIKRLPPIDFDNPWLICGWIIFIGIVVVALSYIAIDAVMGGEKYLYHKDGVADYGPIIEHMVPPSEKDDSWAEDRALHPDFLYEPLEAGEDFRVPPRIVEFYAPWCPHCQHYAPKYKKLASEILTTHPDVKFYAVSCVAHPALCKSQGVKSYPTVKIFHEGSYEPAGTGSARTDVKAILKDLGFDADSESSSSHGDGSSNASSDKKEHARITPFATHEVHDAWWDASLSFEFALSNSIYMENGPLPAPKRDAFHAWLTLLQQTLPPQMGRTHNILNALLDNFSEVCGGQSKLNHIVRKNVPSSHEYHWRTCTYGDNEMGYTCGLWQLFHVMSVGVVEYNRHNDALATGGASETLRNYIDHFFQCDECRMNFLSMYDTCAFDGCHRLSEQSSDSERDWKEFPLWLWETHNDVNVRLLGERLESRNENKPNDFEKHQAQWPSLYSCPNCWRDDHSWEEESVYQHLHKMYWSGNPDYIKIPAKGGVGSIMGGGASSYRYLNLRSKLTIVVFAVVAMLVRLSSSKRVRHSSGWHKKSVA